MAIQRGVALLHEKLEFEKKCTFCRLEHGFTLLQLFFQIARISVIFKVR